jgi:signal-transduction protein with cAMP-binding, CBS, and nucleotidyltransferase domain
MATVREVMTTDPITLSKESSVIDAARLMKDRDIGDVIVVDDDRACGIVTDRDLVVRIIAEGRNPASAKIGEFCSEHLETVRPDDEVGKAVAVMRERKIRRLPVTDGGRPVGVLSLGDLAEERDPESVLASISSSPPNN